MNDIPEAVGARAPKGGAGIRDRIRRHPLARIGPGLVTGAADDDPSGIATYSQAGAQFGLDMLWTMPAAYPLMSAIQALCALIGRTTGRGIAANIRTAFPPAVLKGVVAALLIANVFNIAADVAAMGEVAELVTHIDRHLMTVVFVIVTLALQIYIPYGRYVAILKWLTLCLLSYAAVLFVVRVPWSEVALRTVWPRFTPNAASAAMVVGVFGTTISPYLFFWQASQEVEDMEVENAPALARDPKSGPGERSRILWDTWTGMFYSDLTAYFIILATAVTLHVAGVTDIDSAAKAAGALRPLAGNFAFMLFAVGILGVGLLGVPVLAGAGAYALSEAMGWRIGLGRRPGDARGFYGTIAVSVLAGLVIQYSPLSPMKALFYSAVINGVVAVPLMAIIILLASSKAVMGDLAANGPLVILGWIGTAVMGGAAVCMLIPG